MKFLHLADLHLGKRVNGFSMLEDQAYILRQILAILDDEQPDGVLIAGDVYDKSVPSVEAVGLLDGFLTELRARGVPVLLISGNHDSPERLAFGGKFLRDQVAGALRAGGVGVGEFPAQHPPREQEFGRMIFEALRRGLREPVGERRERAEQPQPAVAERTLRLGEERRAFEQQCARSVLCEAGFAQRAERRAGREQPLHEAVDRREHGYWRFTLIDPTLRTESSSVIDAL